jgi:hypothetical protein
LKIKAKRGEIAPNRPRIPISQTPKQRFVSSGFFGRQKQPSVTALFHMRPSSGSAAAHAVPNVLFRSSTLSQISIPDSLRRGNRTYVSRNRDFCLVRNLLQAELRSKGRHACKT